jgi:magnesium chelatase family protein
MPAAVTTCALVGIDAHLVQVEVDVAMGVPRTSTVGLPDHVVRESKDRIRAALRNSGYQIPPRHITVNLAPAHLRKEGAAYDLPIALAILAATGHPLRDHLGGIVVAGELALDGAVRSIRGALSIAGAARAAGLPRVVVPAANAPEAALIRPLAVLGVRTLADTVDTLVGLRAAAAVAAPTFSPDEDASTSALDLADVAGQEHVKRAAEVAAAGAHNLLLIGPPGAGKTMIVRRLPTILPPLTFEEALEVTKVHSAAGLLGARPLLAARPVRAPHHTCSPAGVFGGGAHPRPGELALAHRGILFLDELPEFRRDVLEGLRQPMEDRCVTVARAGWRATYPTHVMLVGAMNPCACGFQGDPTRLCRCTPHQLAHYRSRLSGPLLDRIDLHVAVAPVPYRDLGGGGHGERSAAVRARVVAARTRQRTRLAAGDLACNAEMGNRELHLYARPDGPGALLLERTMTRLGLSARAYTRVLKVARTIADLAGAEQVTAAHVAEAVQYRSLDRRIAS